MCKILATKIRKIIETPNIFPQKYFFFIVLPFLSFWGSRMDTDFLVLVVKIFNWVVFNI